MRFQNTHNLPFHCQRNVARIRARQQGADEGDQCRLTEKQHVGSLMQSRSFNLFALKLMQSESQPLYLF
jgi:hypothetical protein